MGNALARRLVVPLRQSFGPDSVRIKPAISEHGSSLVHIGLFIYFLLARLSWIGQWYKFLVRCLVPAPSGKSPGYVHPIAMEAYLLLSLLAEAVALVLLHDGFGSWPCSDGTGLVLVALKTHETVSASLFYFVYRSLFKSDEPAHGVHRSFTLALLNLVEVWLLMALLWSLSPQLNQELNSAGDALYYSATSLFTIGFGDLHPKQAYRYWAILQHWASFLLVSIVVARAVASMRALTDWPSQPSAPKGPRARAPEEPPSPEEE